MLTPAMQQYHDIKKEYPDSIIFFRMGDFYEMFGEDAHIAHKVLGINITSRNKNSKNPESLAGIPYHARDKYLPTLVKSGYKVAIVEQVGDPKLKGIVKREVVRVVTPSTLSLEGEQFENLSVSSTIISIVKENDKYGLSIIDIISNKWQVGEFDNIASLSKEIYAIFPQEVVLEKNMFQNEEIKDLLQKKYSLNIYYFETPLKDFKNKLISHFKTKDLKGFGIQDKTLGIKAGALLLSYLELNQKQSLEHLDTISLLNFSGYLELDEATIRNLDLIYNFATNSQTSGTLFGILDKTQTSMGKRFLRDSILKPLNNIDEIKKRQVFVKEFFENKILLDKTRDKLKMIADIDAILNRLALQRCTPRDLINLKKSLIAVLDILKLIDTNGTDKLKELIK